jgi:hypothetical protein
MDLELIGYDAVSENVAANIDNGGASNFGPEAKRAAEPRHQSHEVLCFLSTVANETDLKKSKKSIASITRKLWLQILDFIAGGRSRNLAPLIDTCELSLF